MAMYRSVHKWDEALTVAEREVGSVVESFLSCYPSRTGT